MGAKTAISWTDATWNPTRGCSRVSAGCQACYAERVAARFSGPGMPYEGLADSARSGSKWTGKVILVEDHLLDPIKWKRPRRIFVNSMSDLFHEKLSNEEIAAVFGTMALAPQHTFQILTKRPDRMNEWFQWAAREARDANAGVGMTISAFCVCMLDKRTPADDWRVGHAVGELINKPWPAWPLPNVWLGVSTENQETYIERVRHLHGVPAAVHFISAEPLLGPIDMRADHINPAWLNWVIAGCESGPGARRCDVEWLRSIRDQCDAAHVALFLKQAVRVNGGAIVDGLNVLTHAVQDGDGSKVKSGGVIELPYLDGVQHAAFPVMA